MIVTQSHCEVCAVSLRDVERAVCSWLRARPKLVSLAPNRLADVWTDIGMTAEALGARARRGADSDFAKTDGGYCGADLLPDVRGRPWPASSGSTR